MSTDRIICKHCGNTDSNKMDFSSDGRYVFCHICKSTTPLYEEYRIYELEGVQTLKTRLQSGETLLSLNKYDEAESVFQSLTKDYADDYRTWLGLARAETRDFSCKIKNRDTLRNAIKVSGEGSGIAEALTQVEKHCSERDRIWDQMQTASNQISNRQQTRQELTRTMEKDRTESPLFETISKMKKDLERDRGRQETAEKTTSVRNVVPFLFLAPFSIYWYNHQNELFKSTDGGSALLMLVYFLVMIICCAGLLFTLVMAFKGVSLRRKWQATISNEEKALQEAENKLSSDLLNTENLIQDAKNSANTYQRNLEALKEQFALQNHAIQELRPQWSKLL